MGRYRKATQLVIKVAELSQHIQDKQVLSAQEVAMQDLLMSRDLNFEVKSLSYTDGGEGFEFLVYNKNASLCAHVKFHASSGDIEAANIKNSHMVIERIEFICRNRKNFIIQFKDDIRLPNQNRPIYGSAEAKMNNHVIQLPRELLLQNNRPCLKPRLGLSIQLEITQNQGTKRFFKRPVVKARQISDSYTILKDLYREQSTLPALFEAAEMLFVNFNKIVQNNWDWLFSESDDDLVALPATRPIETPKLTEYLVAAQTVPESGESFGPKPGEEPANGNRKKSDRFFEGAASSATSSTSTSPEKQQQAETPTVKVK